MTTISSPRLYLAGDIVFRPDALAIFERMRAACADAGCVGVAPFDGQESVRGLPPGPDTILAIVKADRALMDGCAAGIFCLDPFRRSADMDPGTAVEIGYMMAQGKPLAGFTIDGRPYPEKVAAYMRDAWRSPLRVRTALAVGGSSGSLEDADGILAHSDGFVQNGMTEGFIRLSGGRVHVDPDPDRAFAAAVADVASRLGTGRT